eukprot:TRINITY_DN13463_c0_g1_i1.p1 TRINITY_DN13463_c0_g1~~TRINITY_DN13463_c0_g1_i1.p1  ORF type:complete len:152 (-),score=22.50 TRINITY_DN13463_c0_g1_i1:168-590(-)
MTPMGMPMPGAVPVPYPSDDFGGEFAGDGFEFDGYGEGAAYGVYGMYGGYNSGYPVARGDMENYSGDYGEAHFEQVGPESSYSSHSSHSSQLRHSGSGRLRMARAEEDYEVSGNELSTVSRGGQKVSAFISSTTPINIMH